MLTTSILHLVVPSNAEGKKTRRQSVLQQKSTCANRKSGKRKRGRDAGPMCRENQYQQSSYKSIDQQHNSVKITGLTMSMSASENSGISKTNKLYKCSKGPTKYIYIVGYQILDHVSEQSQYGLIPMYPMYEYMGLSEKNMDWLHHNFLHGCDRLSGASPRRQGSGRGST